MRRRSRRVRGRSREAGAALLALLGAWACGDGAPDGRAAAGGPDAPVVTDSAGVTLVVHDAAALEAAPRWTVAPEPAVELGGEEGGGPTLHEVADVALLPGGRVAVADGGFRILVFERDGSVVRTLGGEGEGPGEFTRLVQVVPLGGDTLAAYDTWLRRLTVFDGAGAVVRTDPVAVGGSPSTFARLLPMDGRWALFLQGGPFPDEVGRARPPLVSRRLSADLATVDTFGTFPGFETVRTGRALGIARFAAFPHAVARGDSLVVATAEETLVDVVAPGGRLLRSIRWPDRDRTVTEALNEAGIERALATVPEDRRGEMRTFLSDPLMVADRYPPYEHLLTDPDGRIWVGRSPDPADWRPRGAGPALAWRVFGFDGRIAATLATPEGFRPYVVGRGELVGVFKDAFEVETVRVYPFREG